MTAHHARQSDAPTPAQPPFAPPGRQHPRTPAEATAEPQGPAGVRASFAWHAPADAGLSIQAHAPTESYAATEAPARTRSHVPTLVSAATKSPAATLVQAPTLPPRPAHRRTLAEAAADARGLAGALASFAAHVPADAGLSIHAHAPTQLHAAAVVHAATQSPAATLVHAATPPHLSTQPAMSRQVSAPDRLKGPIQRFVSAQVGRLTPRQVPTQPHICTRALSSLAAQALIHVRTSTGSQAPPPADAHTPVPAASAPALATAVPPAAAPTLAAAPVPVAAPALATTHELAVAHPLAVAQTFTGAHASTQAHKPAPASVLTTVRLQSNARVPTRYVPRRKSPRSAEAPTSTRPRPKCAPIYLVRESAPVLAGQACPPTHPPRAHVRTRPSPCPPVGAERLLRITGAPCCRPAGPRRGSLGRASRYRPPSCLTELRTRHRCTSVTGSAT